jgi:hypothetical protein
MNDVCRCKRMQHHSLVVPLELVAICPTIMKNSTIKLPWTSQQQMIY